MVERLFGAQVPAAMWQWGLVALLLSACVVWLRWTGAGTLRRGLGVGVLVGLAAGCVVAWPGMLAAQKMITALAMPTGLLWAALVGLSLAAWAEWQRVVRLGLVALLLLLTVAGNGSVAKGLFAWLESDYATIDPFNEPPYDALVVLGGMTSEGPGPRPQLSGAGDRLVLAARLFLNGNTQQLVCTGSQIKGYSFDETEPRERATQMLEQLGVPREQIVLVQGHNTQEELQAIERLTREHDWQRVGLVTSAWHMPRAMRLAREYGVDVQPVPANFLGKKPYLSRTDLIPSADGLGRMERLAKEALAWIAGR